MALLEAHRRLILHTDLTVSAELGTLPSFYFKYHDGRIEK
jgi:hypothetical protein